MTYLSRRKRDASAHGKRFAFTLVELLTVIAIIALLTAILLPVFAQTREKARQTSCLSNEQQIGLALLQYTHDYDDHFPVGEIAGATTPSAPGTHTNGCGLGWAGQVMPYVKSAGVFHCPDDPTTAVTPLRPVSYALSLFAGGVSQAHYTAPSVSALVFEVAGASAAIGVADETRSTAIGTVPFSPIGDGDVAVSTTDYASLASCSGGVCSGPNNTSLFHQAVSGPTARHDSEISITAAAVSSAVSNSSMFLFADGHVKFCKFPAVVCDGGQPTPVASLPLNNCHLHPGQPQNFTFSPN